MARRGKRRRLRQWCSRIGTAAVGMATVGVLAPGTAAASLPGVPTFTVSSTTNLVTGQDVRVSWENQFLGLTTSQFVVYECAGPYVDGDDVGNARNCLFLAYQYPAASSGSFRVTLYQVFSPLDRADTLHVCKGTGAGTEQCDVVLVGTNGTTASERASVPILFYTSSTK